MEHLLFPRIHRLLELELPVLRQMYMRWLQCFHK